MPPEELHLNLRNLTLDDYGQLQELMDRVYDDIGGAWPKETIKALVEQFPDGADLHRGQRPPGCGCPDGVREVRAVQQPPHL